MGQAKPASYDELFPGRFLKADQFGGKEVTLRILDAYTELMPDSKGRFLNSNKERCKKQAVLVMETPQGRKLDQEFACNKTNGLALLGMFGKAIRVDGGWIGRLVTFAARRVDAFGEEKDAIRIVGSPEIAADMTFTLRCGRADKTFKMKKTAMPANVRLVQPPPQPHAEPSAPLDDTVQPVERPAIVAEREPTDDELAAGEDFEAGFGGVMSDGRIVP